MYQRIALGDVTPNNLGQLRKLNATLFPVEYKESFYQNVLAVGEFAKLVYYNDVCAGAVCCRKEEVEGSDKVNLYIMTLGVLQAYRRLGLGKQLLDHIMNEAGQKDQAIAKVYLHVQINNDPAVEFYKENGFDVTGTQQDYYKNVEPRDAYILEKVIVS
ncbi:acyl-CoA N-acyltransferase [Gongronella butleri]|nr:acyl-CoA N-acyltransferase [Gongronella butleri]